MVDRILGGLHYLAALVHHERWTLAAAASSAAGLMAEINFGAVATGITLVGVAAISIYERMSSARLRAAREWYESDPGKFQTQLGAVQQRLEDANRKLHALNDDANTAVLRQQAENARLATEVQRLQEMLEWTTSQWKAAQAQLDHVESELVLARQERGRMVDAIGDRVDAATQDIKASIASQGASEVAR